MGLTTAMLHSRPVVMVSSPMHQAHFAEARRLVQRAVDDLGLVDAWIFEGSTVASGVGPSAQFLDAARTCDLFVLVLGSEYSQPTRDEYDAAYADRPDKVLPFLVGDGGPDIAEFIADIRDRHTYAHIHSLSELPAAVAGAVRRTVEGGSAIRPALLADLSERLGRLTALWSPGPVLEWEPNRPRNRKAQEAARAVGGGHSSRA